MRSDRPYIRISKRKRNGQSGNAGYQFTYGAALNEKVLQTKNLKNCD